MATGGQTLQAFLEETNLTNHETTLRTAGVAEMEDLLGLEEPDLEGLSMTNIDEKRLTKIDIL